MAERTPAKPAVVIRQAVLSDAQDIVSLLYDSFVEYRSLYTVEGFTATAISEAETIDRILEGPVFVAIMNETVVGTVAIVMATNTGPSSIRSIVSASEIAVAVNP